MKKNFLWIMAAALALVGCSENELLEQQIQDENAIAFDTYVGDNAQTRATVIDNTVLGVKGFGVNAYYTAQEDFAEGAELNFMQNTKVTLNPDKGDNGLWEYSPVKYWPNNAGDKVSFFAYGPYAKDGDANGMVVNGTSIDFTVASEVKEQVDLIYNTNEETMNAQKQAVNERIHFQFAHALSRISFTVEAAVDETTNGTNLLDGNTRINVKKVALVGDAGYNADSDPQDGPFYTTGTLNLLPNADERWSSTTGGQGFVFDGGTVDGDGSDNEFYHTVKDVCAENDTEVNVVQLTRFNASEPQRLLNDESYLMVIPQEGAQFKIYIEYDVISGGNDNDGTGTYDESAIVNKITSTQPLTVTFEQGKAYNFNLILGMTSVKFEASVADWEDATNDYENEEWLPENVGAQINPNENGVFEIYNAKQLARMRDLVNSGATYTLDEAATRTGELSYAEASYILMDNIDLSEYENWTPIGVTNNTPFKGTFDGNGKSITGMTINVTDTEYAAMKDGSDCSVGLFNNVSDAIIKGLSVNGSITTNETEEITWLHVGGIMGTVSNSRVYNCHFSGTLNNSKKLARIGGIIGTCGSSYVVRCTTSGVKLISSANGVDYGGITGLAPQTISACYTYGNDFSSASNLSRWGGIVAYAYNQTSDHIIESCYNYDVVSTSIATNVGAILGQASSCSGQYLANCYSVSMTDVTNFVGSAGSTDKAPLNCGFVASDGDWTNALNAMNNALIELNTLDQNSNQYGLYNLKFETSESGTAYPLVVTDGLAELAGQAPTGEGTEVNPYRIYNVAELIYMRDKVNANEGGFRSANYKLMNDIDLSAVCGEEKASWNAIKYFNGIFDGNNKTISNLYINFTSYQLYTGLFNEIEKNGTLKNLNVEGEVTYANNDNNAAIVGDENYGIVSNCTFSGSVNGGGACIVGQNNGVVIGCKNYGELTTTDDGRAVGGIVGDNYSGKIIGCVNAGNVTATIWVGGICGHNRSYIWACCNIGKITAEDNAAGIFGANLSGSANTTSWCYNSGLVTVTDDSTVAAGIVGSLRENMTFGLCYYQNSLTSSYSNASAAAQSDVSELLSVDWNDANAVAEACQALNKAIEKGVESDTNGESAVNGWAYEVNTDEATKATMPLILKYTEPSTEE